ncbi:MAG TPA: glycosyltransferase, partial [Methylomirabilota bacterium]|nr:glycosyltransferase [Methylomirabilota bacterium]
MAGALRILHLYPKGDFFTGAAVQLHDLAAGLAARGHAVTVATPASETWAARCRAAGVEHVALPMRRGLDPRAAWRLARLVRARRIQVAHAHKGRARTLALLAGVMGARPLLVLNRGVSFPVGGLRRRVGYTSRRVHAIVAVCESIKRGLV